MSSVPATHLVMISTAGRGFGTDTTEEQARALVDLWLEKSKQPAHERLGTVSLSTGNSAERVEVDWSEVEAVEVRPLPK